MSNKSTLPPGQKEYPSFDRFGLGLFADRFPSNIDSADLTVAGNVASPLTINPFSCGLPRVEQFSDFHCVTTWSFRELHWSGIRFSDFYNTVVLPQAKPHPDHHFVVFRSQDNYACSMQLQDLLAGDVLLADTLNGEKLGLDHGAPLRLVAPAHYGYKNVKHINAIEFWKIGHHFRFPRPYPNLMNHPRGRVAQEERTTHIPNWVIRPLYRFLQPFARRKHAAKLRIHLKK